jgi:hypothetical protein
VGGIGNTLEPFAEAVRPITGAVAPVLDPVVNTVAPVVAPVADPILEPVREIIEPLGLAGPLDSLGDVIAPLTGEAPAPSEPAPLAVPELPVLPELPELPIVGGLFG